MLSIVDFIYYSLSIVVRNKWDGIVVNKNNTHIVNNIKNNASERLKKETTQNRRTNRISNYFKRNMSLNRVTKLVLAARYGKQYYLTCFKKSDNVKKIKKDNLEPIDNSIRSSFYMLRLNFYKVFILFFVGFNFISNAINASKINNGMNMNIYESLTGHFPTVPYTAKKLRCSAYSSVGIISSEISSSLPGYYIPPSNNSTLNNNIVYILFITRIFAIIHNTISLTSENIGSSYCLKEIASFKNHHEHGLALPALLRQIA